VPGRARAAPAGPDRQGVHLDQGVPRNLEVVENKLIPLPELEDPFKAMAEKFCQLLEEFRLLTHGQLISRAVAELGKPDVAGNVHSALKHLIVDEYQDVNPAQERLIRLLTGPQVELCVVGDDDQAIYQWRGSDVRNIVKFTERYPGGRTFTMTVNRRSRPHIVAAAASFARAIPGRLDKQMSAFRPPAGTEVVTWAADTEADECARIAETVQRLHSEGLPYRSIAVLVRTRAAYPGLLEAFDADATCFRAWPINSVACSSLAGTRSRSRVPSRASMTLRPCSHLIRPTPA
jgi:DNA helicase II / ATP-dependent DNA helicase PcrA